MPSNDSTNVLLPFKRVVLGDEVVEKVLQCRGFMLRRLGKLDDAGEAVRHVTEIDAVARESAMV